MMMRLLKLAIVLSLLFLGVVLSLALGGCAEARASIFDPAVARQYKKEVVTVTWREVDDLSICQLKTANPLLGCAIWTASTCTIYTYRNPPFDLLGHELLHCFTGNWHPQEKEF